MIHNLNSEERRAIVTLVRLAKEWPKTLWLFYGDGTLHVMRCDENGDRAFRGEGVDQDYIVTDIDIPGDGGGW